MKKNRLFILLIAIVLITSACSSDTPATESTGETPNEPVVTQTDETPAEAPATEESVKVEEPETEEPATDEPKEDAPKTGSERDIIGMPIPQNENIFVTLDDIRYEIFIDEEPDSSGMLGALLLFENNSDYPIRKFELKTDFHGEFDPGFAVPYTVMPGETSSIAASEAKPDMKVTSIQYTIYDDGTNYEISYNAANDEYWQVEEVYIDMFAVDEKDIPVPADFSYDYVTEPPDLFGMVYSDVTITNNTAVPIESIYLTMIDEKERWINHFGSLPGDPVLPPGESVTIKSFGGEVLKPVNVSYSFHYDGQEYQIDYDYKLDQYAQTIPDPYER